MSPPIDSAHDIPSLSRASDYARRPPDSGRKRKGKKDRKPKPTADDLDAILDADDQTPEADHDDRPQSVDFLA